MQRIYKNIYVGSLKDSGNAKMLKKSKIKVVLNVCNDCDSPYIDPEITYIKWGLDDPKEGEAACNESAAAAALLELGSIIAKHRGGNILIHCASGNNRCRFVVARYLYGSGAFTNLNDACIFTGIKDHKVGDSHRESMRNWMTSRGCTK